MPEEQAFMLVAADETGAVSGPRWAIATLITLSTRKGLGEYAIT